MLNEESIDNFYETFNAFLEFHFSPKHEVKEEKKQKPEHPLFESLFSGLDH